jgi:hypothetical protein
MMITLSLRKAKKYCFETKTLQGMGDSAYTLTNMIDNTNIYIFPLVYYTFAV